MIVWQVQIILTSMYRKMLHSNWSYYLMFFQPVLQLPMVEQLLKNLKKKLNHQKKTVTQRNLPKNVPKANGIKGTPITGAVKLMNQFGKNGVILKNSI